MPMKYCSFTGVAAWLAGVLTAAIFCGLAAAQPVVNDLRIDDQDVQIGLGGYMQPGQWASLRVAMTNPTPRALPVICQWEMADVDGEAVIYEREVTLNESRRESIWLYGAISPNTNDGTIWRLRVLDSATRQVLTSVPLRVPPGSVVQREVRLVGITGSVGMGLTAYEVPADERFGAWTQQEGTKFLTSLKPADLPDRWQGMDAMSSLIWTPAGGDPGGTVPLPTLEAIREWVRRGGHLVVILPSVGDLWTGSPLGDLLPIESMTTLSDRIPPAWVGPVPSQDVRLDLKRLQPRATAAVLASDVDDNPLVVAGRFGFGTVTVVGVDLTDTRLAKVNLPSGKWPIWNTIFGWKGPAFRDVMIDGYVNAGVMPKPMYRDHVDLDVSYIPDLIAMQGTASAPLLLAILLFFIYWITAGPVSYLTLRLKKRTRYAWMAFVMLVGLFSAIAWGGAYLLRPVEAQMEHFTFLDFDGDSGLVRGRSWTTVLVPKHGDVELVVDPSNELNNRNLLSAQGVNQTTSDSGYPDPLTYSVSANAPYRAVVPFRSTAKQFSISYLGDSAAQGSAMEWTMPFGKLTVNNGWPTGTLTHSLPVTLQDVRVVYSRGDGRAPYMWAVADEWQSGQRLTLVPPTGNPVLIDRPDADTQAWGGELSTILKKPGVSGRQRIVNYTTMLTLFDHLPPPKYLYNEAVTFLQTVNSSHDVYRTFTRQVDMSPMLSTPCVLLIAYVEDGPLPLPLRVDGDTLPSRGWTVLRCYYPLQSDSADRIP